MAWYKQSSRVELTGPPSEQVQAPWPLLTGHMQEKEQKAEKYWALRGFQRLLLLGNHFLWVHTQLTPAIQKPLEQSFLGFTKGGRGKEAPLKAHTSWLHQAKLGFSSRCQRVNNAGRQRERNGCLLFMKSGGRAKLCLYLSECASCKLWHTLTQFYQQLLEMMMFSSFSDLHNSNTVLINSCPSSLISTSPSHEDVVGLAQVWVGCWHRDKNTKIKPVLQDVSRSVVKSCPQSTWNHSLLPGSYDCTREALKAVSLKVLHRGTGLGGIGPSPEILPSFLHPPSNCTW